MTVKDNKNEPIEKIIAKAIEEKYGSSDDTSSAGNESHADRSVYRINDDVYYSQAQADYAYRETEQRLENGQSPQRTGAQQRQQDTSAPQQRQQEQRRQDGKAGRSKSPDKPSKKKKSKNKKSSSAQNDRKSRNNKSRSSKNDRARNTPNRYKAARKGKTKMDVRDDDIYDGIDIEEEQPQKRKFHPIRTLIKLVLLLLIVAFAAYSFIALHYINMVDIQPEGDRIDTGAQTFDSKGVRNILLIGADGRGNDTGRSDTVILMSINFKAREIMLTSFMRDSYVDIPGHGYNKLNAAYRWGGPELLMDTLELNFRVPVEDYVVVNFESFADIVDAVGGVELSVTQEEAVAMQAPMQEVNDINGKPWGTDFISEGGTYLMNGNQALAYARIRYVGRSDFQRTERQREVIQKIFAKAKKLGVGELGTFLSECAESVTTNMTKGEMYLLSLQMLYFASFDTEELRIPMDDAYTGSMIDGQSVLEIDFDKNIAEIEKRIYS